MAARKKKEDEVADQEANRRGRSGSSRIPVKNRQERASQVLLPVTFMQILIAFLGDAISGKRSTQMLYTA